MSRFSLRLKTEKRVELFLFDSRDFSPRHLCDFIVKLKAEKKIYIYKKSFFLWNSSPTRSETLAYLGLDVREGLIFRPK